MPLLLPLCMYNRIMKQSTFEKEIFIKADAETVINIIADYVNITKFTRSSLKWKELPTHPTV